MSGSKSKLPGEKTSTEMIEEMRLRMDGMPLLTSCVCGWVFSGSVSEGREAARLHREQVHPEIDPMVGRRKRRKHANPARISSNLLNDADREEVEEDRRRRMRLLGITE